MGAVFPCTVNINRVYFWQRALSRAAGAGELSLRGLMTGVSFLSGPEWFFFCAGIGSGIVHPSRRCTQCVTMRASRSLMRSHVHTTLPPAAYKDTMYAGAAVAATRRSIHHDEIAIAGGRVANSARSTSVPYCPLAYSLLAHSLSTVNMPLCHAI